jgi:hypothetical protein
MRITLKISPGLSSPNDGKVIVVLKFSLSSEEGGPGNP